MAKQRGGKRRMDVADLVELVGALANIRNGNGYGHPQSPLAGIDPTINVKDRIDQAVVSLRDISDLRAAHEEMTRVLDTRWQERFDAERRRADEARQLQESGRIDAKIADIVQAAVLNNERLTNAATVLANTVTTTAETARKTVEAAAVQQSELVGQVRDTVTALQGVVTTFIATGGGERTAKGEQVVQERWNERQRSQRVEWQVGLYVAAGIAIAGFALKSLGILH